MTGARWIAAGLAMMVTLAGCRAATRIADAPRVDIELEGTGNRGYLVGIPPPAPEVTTTRQMIRTDVELPSLYRPTRSAWPPTGEIDEWSRPGEAPGLGAGGTAAASTGAMDSYVVQKGDSLWSIAAKPEIYGSATHWRRLYDENHDILSSPNQLKAGMRLRVPRGSETSGYGGAGEDRTTSIK